MTEKFIHALQKRSAAIAKERDRLRELQSEISMLADDCDEAKDNLELAIDALSRLQ